MQPYTANKSETPEVPELSYAQVEALLTVLHDIAPDKRVAFMSRLKHLQKYGLPDRDRTGRGRAATYTLGQLMQLVAGVELLQAGLPPQRAAETVLDSWPMMTSAIAVAVYTPEELETCLADLEEKHSRAFKRTFILSDVDEFWAADADALGDLSGENGGRKVWGVRSWAKGDVLTRLTSVKRVTLIAATELSRKVFEILCADFRMATKEDVRSYVLSALVPLKMMAMEEWYDDVMELIYYDECSSPEEEAMMAETISAVADGYVREATKIVDGVSERIKDYIRSCKRGRAGVLLERPKSEHIWGLMNSRGLLKYVVVAEGAGTAKYPRFTLLGLAAWSALTGEKIYVGEDGNVDPKA